MLKQFCSRCGQPVEADEGWAGHGMACPGCGATMQWPGGTPASFRRQILTALLVLFLLAALLLLLLQPSRFGSAGRAARAGIFGRGLTGLLAGEGLNPAGDPASSGATNSAPTNRNSVAPPGAPAANPALTPPRASPVENRPSNSPPPSAVPLAPVTATNVATTNRPIVPASAPGSVRLNDDFAERLSAAGAKTGDVQISLIWNNLNDLDLHCVDPRREEIFFGRRRSSTGGVLDVDRNADQLTATPVENIFWPQAGAPPGEYQVYVNHYAWKGGTDPTAYKVRILVRGQEMVFPGSISRGQQKRFIHRFTLSPNR